MESIVYIGLDDTDILGSQGTGRIARGLAERLESLGLGHSIGITRHQLLVDSRIPYTSHNSSLCLGFTSRMSAPTLEVPCTAYMKERFQDGSDPGLCICSNNDLGDMVKIFGHLATSEVLAKGEAVRLAEQSNIILRELGGTGGGIIGALAAVALRIDGNNGRFVGLRGIREVSGQISVGELVEFTDITAVINETGGSLDNAEVIDTQEWVRPSLIAGQPVLRVRTNPVEASVWISVEKRNGHKHKQKDCTS